jgi:hypothetical protein
VSSTYRVLCLSHDPAIIAADGDWRRPDAAEQAIANGIDGHDGCDLMIGRYSYPLVAVGCPPSAPNRHPGSSCCHSGTMWIDSDWVRLLAAVQQGPDGHASRIAGSGHFQCWTSSRLRRLRLELGTAHLYIPTPQES